MRAYGGIGYQHGGAGTIYLKSDSEALPRVVIGNGTATDVPVTPIVGLTQCLSVDVSGGVSLDWPGLSVAEDINIIVTDSVVAFEHPIVVDGSLRISGPNGRVEINGTNLIGQDVTVTGGAMLSHTAGQVGLYLIVAGDMAVDETSGVDVSAKGYDGSQGPGAGGGYVGSWYAYGSGGGYGGQGGPFGAAGGAAYGSMTEPVDLGSGGGIGGSPGGGIGGGAARLTISGTLTISGVVSANGGSGWYGGGSGGSVYITASVICGSGTITANGGPGGNAGGGGGRTAISYDTSSFAGAITAYGGSGSAVGGAGTIYTKGTSEPLPHLVVDNGGPVGAVTPVVHSQPFDDVKVANGGVLDLAIAAGDLGIRAITITNQSRLVLTGCTTLTSQQLTVTGASELNLADLAGVTAEWLVILDGSSFETPRVVTATNLSIGAGVRIDHAAGEILSLNIGNHDLVLADGASIVASVILSLPGDLTIGEGSSISADGKGYAGNQGPGSPLPAYHGPGGGYGGIGGTSWGGGVGGPTYGSVTDPTDLGSGGGTSTGYYGEGIGGYGGGAIRLVVGGILRVDGSLTANGGAGSGTSGGGSGGSIYVTVGTLAGTGTISADGGTGGSPGAYNGGGGSGGRTAVYCQTNTFMGVISTYGGIGSSWGGAGTIYTRLPDQAYGTLVIDNGGHNGAWTPISQLSEWDALIVRHLGRLDMSGLAGLDVTHWAVTDNGEVKIPVRITVGSLDLGSGAKLTHIGTEQVILDLGSSLVIPDGARLVGNVELRTAGDVTIESGGGFSADGYGYAGNQGPGSPLPAYHGPGGGYGGIGGTSWGGGVGGPAYGSVTDPTDLGSGGGTSTGYYGSGVGGYGGGAIRLVVGGVLRVDGSLTANGGAGSGTSGGGSGGSIYVTVGTLASTGTISADGGTGGSPGAYNGGGGGGGRIAVYCQTNTFMGVISTYGGIGSSRGGVGTIYLKGGHEQTDWTLALNKQTYGRMEPPENTHVWTFPGIVDQQVRLVQVSTSDPSIVFDLVGPSGWSGFNSVAGQSELVSLPDTGMYSLVVRDTGTRSTKNYAFMLQETPQTVLTPGTSYQGRFISSGQAQLFILQLSFAKAMLLTLSNSGQGNCNELYARLGSPPTRGQYDYRFDKPASSSQEILASMASVGTWYVLVFGESIVTPSDYTPHGDGLRCLRYSRDAQSAQQYCAGSTHDHRRRI